ncbi:hypothetical protein [Neorhodopirellula pilleata]|nr:hypothetical protein [Neorhodopirellula pilleata]
MNEVFGQQASGFRKGELVAKDGKTARRQDGIERCVDEGNSR